MGPHAGLVMIFFVFQSLSILWDAARFATRGTCPVRVTPCGQAKSASYGNSCDYDSCGSKVFCLFWKSRSETGQKLWIVSLWNSKIALDPVRYPCIHMCSTYRKQCFFIFIFMHHCGAYGKKCTHTEEMVMWTEPLNLSGCEWRALAQEPPKTLQSKSNRTERE